MKIPDSRLLIKPDLARMHRIYAKFFDEKIEKEYKKQRVTGFLRTFLVVIAVILFMAAAIAPLDLLRLQGSPLQAVLMVRGLFIVGLLVFAMLAWYRPHSLMHIAPATGMLATLCTLTITLLYDAQDANVVGNTTQFAFIGLVFLLLLPNTALSRFFLTALIILATWWVALASRGIATDAQIFMSGLFVSGVLLITLAVSHREDLMRREQFATMQELLRLSSTDMLTGIANRLAFFACAEYEAARGIREGAEFAVLILDIDHFKNINDQYGHGAGDDVLRVFAQVVAKQLRPIDYFARTGGEEFVILLPDTDLPAAMKVAKRLRHAVYTTSVHTEGHTLHITMSIGIAIWRPGQSDPIDQAIARADRGLYVAKEAGRNCEACVETT